MDSNTIWMERQNKPTLVVRDLEGYAPRDVVYETLLRRGVFKWLSVRRKLIRIKNVWKARITTSISAQKTPEAPRSKDYYRGYRRALEECRAEVRAMCHGPRWDAPDFDREARQWLANRAPLAK